MLLLLCARIPITIYFSLFFSLYLFIVFFYSIRFQWDKRMDFCWKKKLIKNKIIRRLLLICLESRHYRRIEIFRIDVRTTNTKPNAGSNVTKCTDLFIVRLLSKRLANLIQDFVHASLFILNFIFLLLFSDLNSKKFDSLYSSVGLIFWMAE